MKTKTITLRDLHDVLRPENLRRPGEPNTYHAYEIVRLTDSVQFRIGARLSEAEVAALCGHDDWKVTIQGERT